MKRRIVVAMSAAGLLGSVVVAPPTSQAQQATTCTGNGVMTLDPGLTGQPSSGTHIGRDGKTTCDGPMSGVQPTGASDVDWDGRYGTTDGDTCAGGGEGWAVVNFHVPTQDGPQTLKNIITFQFGGASNGFFTGTFEGDHYSGTFRAARLIEGDCVSAPLSKLEITYTGTWK